MQILDLPTGHLLALSAAEVKHVQVLYGRVWLTESGRAEDVFAASGDVIELSRRGDVLVEGLGFARIALIRRSGAAALRVPAPVRAVQAFVGAMARRMLAGRWQTRTT